MKTSMRKIVGLLLALIMVLGLLPVTAFAAAPSRLDITGQVPALGETALSYKDFPIAQEDVHMGNARWVYSLAGEENYDDPHSANNSESFDNAFQPGRRYKLWLSVFLNQGVSGYFDNSVIVTYNGVPVAAENISLTNQGRAVSVAIMFDPLTETVKKPVYKGDIVADGVIHQISEFYDFSSLPEGTVIYREIDEETSITLDAHGDLSPLEVRLPVETSFTLILPSGYVFEDDGESSMECTVRVLPASYTVSFEANGGRGSMADVTVNDSTYILPPNGFQAPSTAKYFAGWALSADGEPVLASTITLTGDTTLYAIWENCGTIIDNTELVYDHSHDTYETVYLWGDREIADPGTANCLDEELNPCEEDKAVWVITDISTGDYELKVKGEDFLTGQTQTLVAIQYIYVFGGSSASSYSIIKRENHYEVTKTYNTYDTYARTAAVTLAAAVKFPVYKGDITADGLTHYMSEFYDLDDLPEGTYVTVTNEDGDEILLDIADLMSMSGCDPVSDSFMLTLPQGYAFPDGQRRCTCSFKITGSDPCEGYTDINRGGWYHDAADFVISRGLMGSTKTTALTFEPNTKVSRAMVASILYRMAGSPAVEYKATFTDVPADKWFTSAIEWCAQNGLASGKGNGKFDPNGNVTRQELAVFMMKMAEYLGEDTSGRADLGIFADAAKVPAWAKTYLEWAVDAGLISGKANGGKTYLAPTDTATRAEFASIIMRFVQNIAVAK